MAITDKMSVLRGGGITDKMSVLRGAIARQKINDRKDDLENLL